MDLIESLDEFEQMLKSRAPRPREAVYGDYSHITRDGRLVLLTRVGGTVVACAECGHAFYELTTHCPGQHLPLTMQTAVLCGLLDYECGRWIEQPTESLRRRAARLGLSSVEGVEIGLITGRTLRTREEREEWMREFGDTGPGGDDE